MRTVKKRAGDKWDQRFFNPPLTESLEQPIQGQVKIESYLPQRQAGIQVFFEPWNYLLVLLYCVDSKRKVDCDDVND